LPEKNRACNAYISSQFFDISYYEPARRRRSQESVVVLQSQIIQSSMPVALFTLTPIKDGTIDFRW
jgi:hypothetical protein